MRILKHGRWLLFGWMLLHCASSFGIENALPLPTPMDNPAPFSAARRVGRIQDRQLNECSGLDTSLAENDLFWAINDSGNPPLLFALRSDGRSLGQVLVTDAQNRDWEGLATFLWKKRPMILIADVGDNFQRYGSYTLYIVQEPHFSGQRFEKSALAQVAWRIVFTYPDRNHDAEAIAVDTINEKIYILTKRDFPPLLFELPLKPVTEDGQPLLAQKTAIVDRIPLPSAQELKGKYGFFRSQPTSLDFSGDGRQAVVLTYGHAYLFARGARDSWATALSSTPQVIRLPPAEERNTLRQREALCFSADNQSVFVTSEGKGAGIYQVQSK